MSTLSAKDRVSLCSFTFSDGRRCRTPRAGNQPHFCFYHAQKEARNQQAGKELIPVPNSFRSNTYKMVRNCSVDSNPLT